MGQAKNLAKGRDGPGQPKSILSHIPSQPLATFLARPVVPLYWDNDGTSVSLSQKVALSHPVENAS